MKKRRFKVVAGVLTLSLISNGMQVPFNVPVNSYAASSTTVSVSKTITDENGVDWSVTIENNEVTSILPCNLSSCENLGDTLKFPSEVTVDSKKYKVKELSNISASKPDWGGNNKDNNT